MVAGYRKPRLLVLTSRYPYPVIGGDRLRIYYMCRELAKDYSLTLLSLCDSQAQLQMSLPEDGLFERVERVFLPRWRSILNVFCALPSRIPLQIAYYTSDSFAQRLNELIGEHDICLAHLIRTGHYIREMRGLIRVLEMTDAISLNYQRVKAQGRPKSLKALAYMIEANRLLAYERAMLDAFENVSLISETDRDFLLDGKSKPSILICSNGVNLDLLPFTQRNPARPIIVFIGNMQTVQNLDACEYFIKEIMPRVKRQLDVSFRIVGRINPADAARLGQHLDVEVTGEVASMASAVADAWVGICPMRIGAGVQNKVLEYMGLGLPALVSPIGAEGLEARAGHDMIVATTPKQWADALVSLWQQPGVACALARSGRTYVETHHDWSVRLAALRDRIAQQCRVSRTIEQFECDAVI